MIKEKNLFKDVEGQAEDGLQQKCYVFFWNTYPELRGLLFHVPNGGKRSKREGWKFNQIGLVSGVADLILIHDAKVYCIELKNAKGNQKPEQKAWQNKVESQGVDYYIIRTLEDFKILIKSIINNG